MVGDHLKYLRTGGRIVLKWIFSKWVVEASTRSIFLTIWTG